MHGHRLAAADLREGPEGAREIVNRLLQRLTLLIGGLESGLEAPDRFYIHLQATDIDRPDLAALLDVVNLLPQVEQVLQGRNRQVIDRAAEFAEGCRIGDRHRGVQRGEVVHEFHAHGDGVDLRLR